MRGLAHVVICGNLCRDPETRQVQGDAFVTKFTVAVNRSYLKNGEKVQDVAFVDCEAWKRGMEHPIARFTRKGDAILVTGDLRQDKWEDANGIKRSRMVVRVGDFTFLGQRREGDGEKPDAVPGISEADMPF